MSTTQGGDKAKSNKTKVSGGPSSTSIIPSKNKLSSSTKKEAKKPNDSAATAKTIEKAKSEIDDLFADATKKKRTLDEAKKQADEEEAARSKRERLLASEERKIMDIAASGAEPKVHRWDQESGLPVYKYYHLKIGEKDAGFTPLCPFDCNCCF